MKPRIEPSRLLLLFGLLLALPLAASEKATPVTLTESVARDLVVTVEAPGELESLEQPEVAAEVEGRILALHADEGDAVGQGALLAELDAEPFELTLQQAQAEQARLEAQIRNQIRTLERFRELARQRSSAQSDVDQAATDLAVLRAQLAGIEASIAEANYRLDHCRVTSPVTGGVQRRMVSVGDYVKGGDPLFQVVADGTLRARLHLPESQAAKVRVGLPVSLRLAGDAGVLDNASITALRPMLEQTTRGLEALVDFPNPGGWRPGYSLTARVTLETRADAVMIPRGALVRRPAGTLVYKANDGKAVAQPVETGLHDGDWVEVRSGLAAGESVVLDGAGFLTDGAAISVREQ